MTRASIANVLASLVLLLGLATQGAAQESYLEGRFRDVSSGVTVQRGSEPGSEEAEANLPFLPGDRVWTDDQGTAEIELALGGRLHVDAGTKLEYQSQAGDRTVLRLFAGSIILRVDRPAEFEIESGSTVIVARERGAYGIVSAAGETRLSVYEGEATLEADRQVNVRRGERVYAERGRVTDGPDRFDVEEDEAYARLDDDREDDVRGTGARSYLPAEVANYAPELESHGSWYYEAEVGHVWRPAVSVDWRPYSSGRWIWTAYGWTWVPEESWGWAPFHYGRWDYSFTLGWYWIPGRVWSPAWVSWAVAGDHVGWCPMGRHDRAVVITERRPGGGLGTQAHGAWIYSRRTDLGSRDRAVRRTTIDAGLATRVVPGGERLTRDLRVTQTPIDMAAIRRGRRTRPTIGDTVPELRTDPATTPGRRWLGDPDGRVISGGAGSGRGRDTSTGRGHATDRAIPRDTSDRMRERHPADRVDAAAPSERTRHATDRVTGTDSGNRERDRNTTSRTGSSWDRSGERRGSSDGATDRRRDGDATARAPRTREPDARGASDSDRDVLRRLFRPSDTSNDDSRRRTRDRSDSQTERRSEPRRSEPRVEQRSEPRRTEPRAEPRSEPRREPRAEPRSEPRRSEPRAEPRRSEPKPQTPPPAERHEQRRKDRN